MAFISIGGLLPGLSTDDIQSGISQPRNQHLEDIFHRLRLIESYGTGIRRIFYLYRDCKSQPRIEVTSNTFKMVLPNRNAIRSEEISPALSEQKQKILYFNPHYATPNKKSKTGNDTNIYSFYLPLVFYEYAW